MLDGPGCFSPLPLAMPIGDDMKREPFLVKFPHLDTPIEVEKIEAEEKEVLVIIKSRTLKPEGMPWGEGNS